MCTDSVEKCSETLEEQATASSNFFRDLGMQNYVGAVISGANVAEAYAIAKCPSVE